MALVELDDQFFRDERFDELARHTGRGKHEERSRILGLWHDCIMRTQPIRGALEIDTLVGWFDTSRGHYGDFMVSAMLATKTPDGQFRIKGVEDRMRWLQEWRAKSSAGGKARAARAGRDASGRFGGHQPMAGKTPANAGGIPATGQPTLEKHQRHPAIASQTPAITSHHQPPVPDPYSLTLNPHTPPLNATPQLNTVTGDSVKRCVEAWLETLAHFKQGRKPIQGEDVQLARALARWGEEHVILALRGMRSEKKSEDAGGFDPSQHVSLARVLSPEKFARFVGLGVAQANAKAARAQKMTPVQGVPAANEPEDVGGGLPSEEIRAKLRAQFPAMRLGDPTPARTVELPEDEPETEQEIREAIDASLRGEKWRRAAGKLQPGSL